MKPTVTIPNANIGGKTVTGTFVFPSNFVYEFKTESAPLVDANGTSAVVANSILKWLDESEGVDLGNGVRQSVSVDVGGGAHVVTLDFSGFEGSPHQWGDSGDGNTPTDATGEGVLAQMSVFDKYLNATTLDSQNPATIEVAEYSTDGRYAPLDVVPRNPNVRFDTAEQSSVYDGSVDWVETINASDPVDAQLNNTQ